jgi:hypothetical protein
MKIKAILQEFKNEVRKVAAQITFMLCQNLGHTPLKL